MTTPGVTLVYHNAGGVNVRPDPAKLWNLEAVLSPPDFMNVFYALFVGGTETLRLQADTREELDLVVAQMKLRNHPRLRQLTFRGPDKFVEVVQGACGAPAPVAPAQTTS